MPGSLSFGGIKAHGALAVAQLMHAGALSQGNRFRDTTAGPSPGPAEGRTDDVLSRQRTATHSAGSNHGRRRSPTPSLASLGLRHDARSGSPGSTQSRSMAPMDIFSINSLTNYTNNRTDQWGGATADRLRLILETLKAVRATVGASVPVGVRISQGKVNDYHHKWADAERDADIIFGSLADAGADFIHVTEREAWKSAFALGGPSLVHLAKRYAPSAAILANGSLHAIERAVAALNDGADIVTIGRGALANPDLPRRWSDRGAVRDFDPTILGPIANIKETELVM